MFFEKGQRGGEFPESSFCFTLDTVPVYEFEIFLIGNGKQFEILVIWWLDCSIRARPHHNSVLRVLPRLVVQSLSHVQLFVTPWTVAHQALLSMGFQARVLEWVAISFSRGSSWPGIKPASPALEADSLPLTHQGSPVIPAGCPLNQDGHCIPRRCVGFGVHNHRQAPVSPPTHRSLEEIGV